LAYTEPVKSGWYAPSGVVPPGRDLLFDGRNGKPHPAAHARTTSPRTPSGTGPHPSTVS
jgi:hypothetical protein